MTRAALAAAVLLAMTGCGLASHPAIPAVRPPTAPSSCRLGVEAGQPLPDPHCTPGAVAAGIGKEQLCPHLSSRVVRDVSAATRARVQFVYGDRRRGEVDHLISLELGGSNDVTNLWPEDGPIPNLKDRLENRLHADVCNRTVSLVAAQTAIRTDWVQAYRRYVGPLPTN